MVGQAALSTTYIGLLVPKHVRDIGYRTSNYERGNDGDFGKEGKKRAVVELKEK